MIRLARIKSALSRRDGASLEKFMLSAERFEVIIGQSSLGKSFDYHLKRAPDDIVVFFLALSKGVMDGVEVDFSAYPWRISAIFSLLRGMDVDGHLLSALDVSDKAKASLKGAKKLHADLTAEFVETRAQLDAMRKQQKSFEESSRAELDALRKTYRSEVQTEEAANYWGSRALWARVSAFLAFALFVVMVGVPLWWGWTNFDAILSFATGLTAVGSSVWSLAPIILITIPALAYGWVLRHVSRLYVQSLTIADDASYRRTMAVTYLGLNKDPNSGITTQERAIILNALFRPAPPHTADDGPPTGLLDLIKKQA